MEIYLVAYCYSILMSELLEREYTITPSGLVRGVTWFVILLFISMTILIPMSIYYFDKEIFVALLVFMLFIILYPSILAGSWVFSPQKYLVSGHRIKIVRPVSSITIQIAEITEVEEKDINVFKTIRVLGNGGLFAFTGTFYNKADGKFWMYAKNKNYVMLHTNDKKYVLSPDEKEQFIIDLRNKLGRINKDSTGRSGVKKK